MAPEEPNSDDDGLVVIHAGLFRTATASMAEAYRILGYKVHHGLEDSLGNPWTQLEYAAEATWPTVPNARPRPRFTRRDWDMLWGTKVSFMKLFVSSLTVINILFVGLRYLDV
jgi:hypothetical protein